LLIIKQYTRGIEKAIAMLYFISRTLKDGVYFAWSGRWDVFRHTVLSLLNGVRASMRHYSIAEIEADAEDQTRKIQIFWNESN
jgi:hypothetical protein